MIGTFNLKFDLLTFFLHDSSINNRECQEQVRSEKPALPRRWNRLSFSFRLCSALGLMSCPTKLHLCPQMGKIFSFFLKCLVTISNTPPACENTHTHTNYGSPHVVKTHRTQVQLKDLPTRLQSNTTSPLMIFSTLHLFVCFKSGRKSLN